MLVLNLICFAFILLFTHFFLPLPLHTHPALWNYTVSHVGFCHVLRPVDGQSQLMLKGARVRLIDGLLSLTDRFQVAQIPEYKPVVAETKTSTCREQRNSLFGGKPFYSSSIRRCEFQTPELSSQLTGALLFIFFRDELIRPLCFPFRQVKGCRDNAR